MCGKLKLELLNLRRVAIGRVSDNDLEVGEYRKLTESELKLLREADI
jgi:16S rRNA U516 pseudouridylate synthase RsuA-like enzyme